MVSILPAVDVFLLHPPVVVNGGTRPLTPNPASSAAAASAAAAAAAAVGNDSATPDQIATPDIMSPETKDESGVEGEDNGNFSGKSS